jgi:hypothetical protein
LRSLLFSDILIRFCERIPYAWVVIYSMDQVRIIGKEMGALVSVEMITAMMLSYHYFPHTDLFWHGQAAFHRASIGCWTGHSVCLA